MKMKNLLQFRTIIFVVVVIVFILQGCGQKPEESTKVGQKQQAQSKSVTKPELRSVLFYEKLLVVYTAYQHCDLCSMEGVWFSHSPVLRDYYNTLSYSWYRRPAPAYNCSSYFRYL